MGKWNNDWGIPNADIEALQARVTAAEAEIDFNTLTLDTAVNAVAADGTLTISGVVIDGETVTIGDDTYEFAADDAQTVTSGNIAVDITAVATASQGTLTIDTQPASGDTMTIGTKEYTFVPDGTATADGEISIGTDLATAQANIVAAVNGADSVNTAHTLVTIADFETNAAIVTAIVAGTAGDAIDTLETFTAGTNVFDAVTLGTTTAGVDCVAADAVTALVAAESPTAEYTLADGAGDTVTVTYDTKGVIGNAVDTTETMANGEFAETTLTGGIDGTVGTAGEMYADASGIWYLIVDNTISDANWKQLTV